MKFLVGYSNDASSKDALRLGISLAEMTSGSVVICQIVVRSLQGLALSKIDEDYNQFLCDQAQHNLEQARNHVPAGITANYITHTALSISDGLVQTARDISADCIVVGGARSGKKGQFYSGMVAGDLLNHARLPIALAPRNFYKNETFQTPLGRLSCAFSGSDRATHLAVDASEWAEIFQVPLRFVTFAVRDRDITPTAAGFDAENMVINEWREQIEAKYKELRQSWDSDVPISFEIGEGATWQESIRSIDWQASELLIIGSGRSGILQRVFVGNHAEKIIRHATVPRLILPASSEISS
ncbi:universal stress protein [Acinetobacter qingfengensis]|uniref:UspA domain-containing protein n=1 Tax=Acinetobacter qingfengensis TaxID=1262585 RepID=A0A1E7QZM8_9GAMM|nr:universal stress protein [Acinetobacter qingfengensis]KAA8734785.1 universal stress protein [Acinetobacter qingfengensis]OEY92525.1 hypothetical protein BJI46_14615 [Acinetobacter qingfengensis]